MVDSKDMIRSLLSIEKLYSRAHFDEIAKFGFLRIAVTKIPSLASFDMYRGVPDFSSLKKAIKDFHDGKKVILPSIPYKQWKCSRGYSKKSRRGSTAKSSGEDKKLLIRRDSRVKHMETRIEKISD